MVDPLKKAEKLLELKKIVEVLIFEEVLPMLETRKTIMEMGEIVSKKPNEKIGELARALSYSYTSSMVIAIGRLIDTDHRNYSLLKLIQTVLQYSDIFTKATSSKERQLLTESNYFTVRVESSEFQIIHPKTEYQVNYHPAEMSFPDVFTDLGVLNMEAIRRDLDQLRSATKQIKSYRNTVVAHSSKELILSYPTFDDLNKSIDVIKDLTDKYYLLITQNKIDLDLKYLSEDWHDLFNS